MILVLCVLLIGSVPISYGVASSSFANDQVVDAHLGARYQVTAKAFPGPPALTPRGADRSPVMRRVRGSWTAPNGAPRSGDLMVELSPGGPDAVKIWVDRDGVRQPAPRSLADLLFVAILNGIALELGFVVAALLVYVAARFVLDRGRDRDWEHDWRRLAGVGTEA
ncbi:hypothetical protein ABZU76_45000 [Amycolatopsis sp. NPDC005232]|uniref:Rv1733c family protein n=1 Tax=Amycolatopsis sp. NPDC005232 TaxID=3157027 RepID=UPI0033B1A81E